MRKRGPKERFKATPQDHVDSVEAIEFRLHQTQHDFVCCDASYKGLTSGRGGGKSFIGAYDFLIHSKPGAVGLVIAPTYKMLMDSTQRTFIELATKLGLWDEKKFRKTDNVAILTNGYEVLFRSGEDPNKLRGSTVYRIWADECSLLKEDVYEIAIACLRWPGEDKLVFTGTFTPSGKDHWTYRVFGDKSNPNVSLFQCSTKDNPFLPEGFYERLLLQYGKGEGGILRAMQELEGQFVCVEGAEWGPENFGPQIWFSQWPTSSDVIRAVALDSSKGIGGKTGDYSVFTIGMYAKGKVWVEFDLDNTRNASGLTARAIEIQKAFNPDYFGVEEEFGGAVLVDDLMNRAEKEGILMPLVLVPTQGLQKDVRIRRITPYLTNDMLRFKDNEQTRQAVQMFESWPHSEHDDPEDSLEMFLRILNESGMFG
jgi:PBSX family phage terminase large subunit